MVSNAINEIIKNLEDRQKQIISGRFGLYDGQKQTLASLGEKYGITRERVRQIEAEALQKIQANAQRAHLEKIVNEKIARHLNDVGGLRRDDIFLNELKEVLRDDGLHHWHLRFLSEIVGSPSYYELDDKFHFFWYLENHHIDLLDKFVNELEKLIADKKEELIALQKFDAYLNQVVKKMSLPEMTSSNYISISKKFDVNAFGDFGLSEWEEITPKTIRSKAYLVLKKKAQPMHFKEVAEAINGISEEKVALPQTVHNELIKDERIVLVGRGMYALQEHGFAPGSTKELIYNLIKKSGPLHPKEIVSAVNAQRFIKDNTILLSIQNKKLFKKLSDGKIGILD